MHVALPLYWAHSRTPHFSLSCRVALSITCVGRARTAGEIPDQDDVLNVGGVRFEVLEADERRLLLLRACNSTLADGTSSGDGAGSEKQQEALQPLT